MIINFSLHLPCGKEWRASIICPSSVNAVEAERLLRDKLRIPTTVSLVLQLEHGTPIRNNTVALSTLRKQRDGARCVLQVELLALVTGPEAAIASIDFSQAVEAGDTDEDSDGDEKVEMEDGWDEQANEFDFDQPMPTARIMKQAPMVTRLSEGVDASSITSSSGQPPVRIQQPLKVVNRVTKRNPYAAPPPDVGSGYDPADPAEADFIDLEGLLTGGPAGYGRAYARRNVTLSHLLAREYPILMERDPPSMVKALVSDERTHQLPHDPKAANAGAVSDLKEVSDAMYAQLLSVAVINAVPTRQGTGVGEKLALYPEIAQARHSCYPNAMVHYELYRAPYPGTLRCGTLDGVQSGGEVTCLYRHADSLAFMLLPRERRQKILRARYYFDCKCARCQCEVISDVVEATLTGVFWTDSSADRDEARQAELAAQLRDDFEPLGILDPEGLQISLVTLGNVPPAKRMKRCRELLAFITKYGGRPDKNSVLRLHDHHWRLSLARCAYIHETVRLCAVKGVTPEVRQRDPSNRRLFTPPKAVYDLCLKQLMVEAIFIPSGHPHRLTTFESFQFLVAVLPANLADAVMRTANGLTKIPWEDLRLTKDAWGVLKRASLPPNIQRAVVDKQRPMTARKSV